MSEDGFDARMARVDALIAGVEAGPDGPAKERVRELIATVLEMHGTVLSRVIKLVEPVPGGDELLRSFAADELVASVLTLHGLHPIPLAERVRGALEALSRTLAAEAVTLELSEASPERVVVRVVDRPLAAPRLPPQMTREERRAAPAFGGGAAARGGVALPVVSAPGMSVAAPPVAAPSACGGSAPSPLPLEPRVREAVAQAAPEVAEIDVRWPEPRPRCELCRHEIGAEHEHLAEPAAGRLLCACLACCTLLGQTHGQRFRRIPRRGPAELALTDQEWEMLALPVNLVFFLKNSRTQRVDAFYPGATGTTECALSLDAWNDVAAQHPELAALEPDVEALLVHRVGSARDHLVLPIDACYRLVGLLRQRAGPLSGPMATQVVGEWIAEWRARAGGETVAPAGH